MTKHELFRCWITLIAVLLVNALPASAASLTFTPSGSQLDGDPINDILPKPGELVSFDVVLNTAGLAGNLTNFSYRLIFDGSELNFANIFT